MTTEELYQKYINDEVGTEEAMDEVDKMEHKEVVDFALRSLLADAAKVALVLFVIWMVLR